MNEYSNELEDARVLSLQGEYEAALQMLNAILIEAPRCLDALRLKGNALELKAFDESERTAKPLATCADYIAARACYESILKAEPNNALAQVDLADHFKNLGAFDKALEHYASAIDALKGSGFNREYAEEISERLAELSTAEAYKVRLAELSSRVAAVLNASRRS